MSRHFTNQSQPVDLLDDERYNPDPLLDAVKVRLKLKNDAALSRLLDVAPPVISKLRHRRLPVSPALLLRIHDETGLPVDELRGLMGVKDAYRAGHRIAEVVA